MAEFLSAEWLDELRGRGCAPGPSLVLQVVVTGGPTGDAKFYARIADGVVAEAELGSSTEPDVTLTVTHADALATQAGMLDPTVAFMQGRMKTAGDPGMVLDLLAHAASKNLRR